MTFITRTTLTILIALFIVSGVPTANATTLNQSVFNVLDQDPAPGRFVADLSAAEQDVDINGTTVHAMIYKDVNNPGTYSGTPNGIPIPQIVVNVGDEVVVTLTNDIPMGCAAIACNSSIHWHGIELDNDSDGTGVTQTHLEAGDTYIYRFIPPRPGVFWFHTHMLPGAQTFAGMYGAIIVKGPNEATLAGNEIPKADNTHTVVLSDTEYDADGDVGFLDAGQAVPWATLKEDCANNAANCNTVASGDTVLVNGQKPAASTHTIKAKSGSGIRLRLINTATNRYFRLKVSNNGADNKLYRIGGEGGFLEKVRLEGGKFNADGTPCAVDPCSYDTKYDVGEILVPASGRSDVVIVPTGTDGTVITISGEGYARGGPSNNEAAGDLLYIEIDDTVVDDAFTIAVNNDVLGEGVIDNLKSLPLSSYATPPIEAPYMGIGSTDPQIRLGGIMTGHLAIDGVEGHFEDSGSDYTLVPYQGATRYAKVDDVLEFTISNFSGGGSGGQHHPFHHHGFSFQPVRIIQMGDLTDKENTAGDTIIHEFDYNEFIDVIDIGQGQRVVVRMRIDDRPRITDYRADTESMPPAEDQHFPDGGAEGRWVFHCHLFLHAALGMISELVILPNNPPVADAGPDQTVECASHSGNVLAMDGSGSMDPDGDSLTYLWTAPGIVFSDPTLVNPTATFPQGSTTVTLTVSDGSLDDSDTMNAQVVDTTPPTVDVALDPSVLWPPDHTMRDITASVLVTDTCDANPTFVLTSITSSDPEDGTGDGNTMPDIEGAMTGTPDLEFQVRAERDGAKDGRTYTVTYTGSDGSGNDEDDSAVVVAPHNNN